MKTAWKSLKSDYEQIKIDDLRYLTEEQIKKLMRTRFNLTDFASMVASMNGLLPSNKKYECILVRDEVAKHPRLSNHPKVKYFTSIHYREMGTENFLGIRNVFAIELRDNPTIKEAEGIVNQYFATPNVFVALYDPRKIGDWLITLADSQGNLSVAYATQFG